MNVYAIQRKFKKGWKYMGYINQEVGGKSQFQFQFPGAFRDRNKDDVTSYLPNLEAEYADVVPKAQFRIVMVDDFTNEIIK